jgi:hypothetical protein
MTCVEEILREAREHLLVAKSGLAMIVSGLGEGRIGLRNVAVFGRMVTFATNNLRSCLSGFDDWDIAAKRRHFDNTDCRYMNELRNVIEKQARTPVSMSAHIYSFRMGDQRKFERPPGATSFFIGDRNGGSGWLVPGPDGNEVPFYVALPPEIGKVTLSLPENGGRSAAECAGSYVAALEAYLDDLKRFAQERQR